MGTGRRAKTSLSKFEKRGQHPAFIGEILFQRYVLHAKIERNRFCSKWLAFDSKTEKFVRVVIFREGKQYIMQGLARLRVLQFIQKSTRSMNWVDKLKFYGQNMYSLQTHNGVESFCTGYYNCFIHEGTLGKHFCLVQEYNQFTLKDVFLERIKLPAFRDQILTLCIQIVVALNFLHFECGVIHGDLNPSNIRLKLPEPLSQVFIARKLMEANLEAKLRSKWESWRDISFQGRMSSIDEFGSLRGSFDRRDSGIFQVNTRERRDPRRLEQGRAGNGTVDDLNTRYSRNRSRSLVIVPESKKKPKKVDRKSKCDFSLLDFKKSHDQKSDSLFDFHNFRVNIQFLRNFQSDEDKFRDLIRDIIFPRPLTHTATQKLKIRIDGLDTAKFANEINSPLPTSRDFKAPERLFKKKITPKADVWSLGCIIYKMINKRDLYHTKKDPYFDIGKGQKFSDISNQNDLSGTQKAHPAPSEKFKFVGDQIDSIIGDDDLRQAMMIHCKIQSLPSFMWQAPPLRDFLQFRVKRFIRNEQMESDILDSYCKRNFDKNSKACRDTNGEFFKIEEIRRSKLKSLLFENNTLESFLKNTEELNRVFYKDFARVARKYRFKPKHKRSIRKYRLFFERHILSKILSAALQVDPSTRPSSRDLFLILFKFLFLQKINDRKHLQFYKKNSTHSGVGYKLFVSRLKSYLGYSTILLSHKNQQKVFPEDAERMLTKLIAKDSLYRKQGLLAEISTDIPSAPMSGEDPMDLNELKTIRSKPMFITDEKLWEKKERLFLKQFQGRKDVVDLGLFDLQRYYKHV